MSTGKRRVILVDTHVPVWLDQGLAALGDSACSLIDKELRAEGLFVSAISFWEIAMLVSKARLVMRPSVLSWQRVAGKWPERGRAHW